MSTDQDDTVYQVYLLEDDPDVGLESPVEGERLDFFDTGVWVQREAGRDFFPYERVQFVREREATADET